MIVWTLERLRLEIQLVFEKQGPEAYSRNKMCPKTEVVQSRLEHQRTVVKARPVAFKHSLEVLL